MPDGGVGIGHGTPLLAVLGIDKQPPAQDGREVGSLGRRIVPRGAGNHRVHFAHHGNHRVHFAHHIMHLLSFVPVGVMPRFGGGNDQHGAGAVGHRFGNGRQPVAETVASPTQVAIHLLGGGDPAHQLVHQYQRRTLANQFLEPLGAGVGESVVIRLHGVVGGFAAQVVSEESGKGFGAAVGSVQGHALQNIGVLAGEADQLYIVHSMVVLQ